jgi:WD40 repeat protein
MWLQGGQQQQQKRETRAKFAIADLPVNITSVLPPTNKPNPKLGISLMSWSSDGTLLATVNENMPHAVWVWEVEQAELSTVVLHISPVKSVEWAPQGHSLAICTGSPRVYLWSPGGASVVHVPLPGFSAFKVAWSPGADSFVLMDKGAFCCAYVAGDVA